MSLFLIDTIKNWFILKTKRNQLISQSLLAIDSYYELGDGKRGVLKSIGSQWIRLEDPETKNIYNLPITQVLNNAICKIHSNEESESINTHPVDTKSEKEKVKLP